MPAKELYDAAERLLHAASVETDRDLVYAMCTVANDMRNLAESRLINGQDKR